jgi:FkbM family methyltransferase
MKQLFKQILKFFGLNITRLNKELSNLTFDEIYLNFLKISDNPIIFDVGANEGQSINRFKKIYRSSIIHSFEPSKKIFGKLRKNFENEQNVYLNNCGLGNEIGFKQFNLAKQSGASSFHNFNSNSRWLKKRSKQFNTSRDNFTEIETVKINTLDEYCSKNNIQKIDILKIDTQGYEDEVLKGALNTIKEGKISAIEFEIILDDVYKKRFSFYELEKIFINYNFRLCGVDLANNNLFSGIVFFANVLYINNSKIKN